MSYASQSTPRSTHKIHTFYPAIIALQGVEDSPDIRPRRNLHIPTNSSLFLCHTLEGTSPGPPLARTHWEPELPFNY